MCRSRYVVSIYTVNFFFQKIVNTTFKLKTIFMTWILSFYSRGKQKALVSKRITFRIANALTHGNWKRHF